MKWVSHYDFMDKYIDEFFKGILKEEFKFSYQGFVSAHGDKFYSEKTSYEKRNIGFGVGVMLGMIISYKKPYRLEYETNKFSSDWYWKKFDSLVNENFEFVMKYNRLWYDYVNTGEL